MAAGCGVRPAGEALSSGERHVNGEETVMMSTEVLVCAVQDGGEARGLYLLFMCTTPSVTGPWGQNGFQK